jgi:ferrous iron transport protein B
MNRISGRDPEPKMSPKSLTIALAGNPNSGKTTIFNNITGTRQKVGNWPGVTVEKKEGSVTRGEYDLRVVDLPGTYSLTPYSIEEIVARNFILDEKPEVVIDIIDASNLERSLYLATQLREIDCKVIFALNMADVAETRGVKIDARKLSQLLEVPVVFTVGNKNKGIEELLDTTIAYAESGAIAPQKRRVKYNRDIEEAISSLQSLLDNALIQDRPYSPRWASVKLLENDKIIKERLEPVTGERHAEILEETERLRQHIRDRLNEDPEIVMTDDRYGFIAGIVKEVLTTAFRQRVDISRNIDMVLTNRFLGFPIFLFFIWAMFQLTFTLGEYPMVWIETGIDLISKGLDHLLPAGLFKDLLLNGVIAGVGSVIVFLPNILILFFCIALFEDTGYMSRAAFLMDKIMHLIGLHGKSFIPMLMGFGCNVPAVMASRTLESEKDRILTILITPFMSCSAKLPVYVVLAGSFFGPRAGTVIFFLYLAGILMAVISGRIFRSTLLRGADAPFVMELPPYRAPMGKSLLIHMWDRSKIFLKKMGGVILVGSVVIWVLSTFPRTVDYSRNYEGEIQTIEAQMARHSNDSMNPLKKQAIRDIKRKQRVEQKEKSLIGILGRGIAPVFDPLGIDWRGGVALLTGFVAKEIVVSTMGVLHAVEGDEKGDALPKALKAAGMTPLSAMSMMIFVLLYLPCIATITTIWRETNSIKWMLFSIFYSTAMAWVAAFVVYQGGRLLGFA